MLRVLANRYYVNLKALSSSAANGGAASSSPSDGSGGDSGDRATHVLAQSALGGALRGGPENAADSGDDGFIGNNRNDPNALSNKENQNAIVYAFNVCLVTPPPQGA